jgi:hypothetical protein
MQELLPSFSIQSTRCNVMLFSISSYVELNVTSNRMNRSNQIESNRIDSPFDSIEYGSIVIRFGRIISNRIGAQYLRWNRRNWLFEFDSIEFDSIRSIRSIDSAISACDIPTIETTRVRNSSDDHSRSWDRFADPQQRRRIYSSNSKILV